MFAQFTARARGDARWLRRSGILLAFAALLVVPNCKAQLPQAGDTTSPPTPGVGHDYIHAPEETVNPANGSVSIRIPVRVPQGRELTLPLYIAYDSNGAFYYGQSPGNQQPHYATTTNVPFSLGGWSYTFPMLTYQLVTWTQQYKSGKNYTCTGSMNYVFQDPTGNRHSLPLTVAATSGPGGADCGGNNATQGSEGPILAISGLPSWGWGTYPTATVTNGNGTVYSFPGGLETLPTSVTDRNGNTISISSTSSSATLTDTVGRTAVSVPTFGASTDNISVAGLGAPYAVSWTSASANFTIGTVNLNPSTYQDCPTSMSASASVVSQVALPNGQKYTFSYDPTYGMLKQITYPSGGSVRYQWGLNTQSEAGGWTASTGSEWYCSYDFPAVTDRWVNDGTKDILHQQFSYSTTWNGSTGQWTTKKTIVTTYDLIRNTSFQTIYTYTPVPSPSVPNPTGGAEGCGITCAIPVEASIEYYGTDGKLLKTVAKTWCNNDPRELCSEQTTLDNGDTSEATYSYDANEQQTERDEYDGSGTSAHLLRKTATSYASFSGAHIVDLPSSETTYDGSGNPLAETDSSYDQTAPQGTSVVQHVAAPGGTARGNLTTVVQHCFGCAANPTTTYADYDTGQVYQRTDPKGSTTSHSYADSYGSCGGNAPPSGSTGAYLTQVTYPQTNGVSHVESFCYDYSAGLLRSSTDQNGQVTSYQYSDSLDRLTETDYPDTGQTLVSYNDMPPSPSLTVEKKLNASGQYSTTTTTMNGLGLATETALTTDPAGTDYTSTVYDGLGRALQVEGPFRGSCSSNCETTTYTYDALGRTTSVVHSDTGSTVQTLYLGRAVEVTDEGNGSKPVQRISEKDALGHLVSVCEVSSTTLSVGSITSPGSCNQEIGATGFLTQYVVDALGNLKSVSQPGLNTRTYSYNSLSELLSAYNPESGTTTYTYDPNGNLQTKTDSRGFTTTYTYDALNRLTSKGYSDGTPAAYFSYDTCPNTCPSGVSPQNPIGRLIEAYTANTQTIDSYDPMGRVAEQWQCSPLNCGSGYNAMPYSYDLAGDVTAASNGTGLTFSYAYDGAQQLIQLTSSLSDANHPGTLLSGLSYNALGEETSGSLGNKLSDAFQYTPRGWLESIAATGVATPGQTTLTISGTEKFTQNGGVAGSGSLSLSGSDQSKTIPGTSGTGSVTFNGSEQSKQTAATQATGWVTIDGSEQSVTINTCQSPQSPNTSPNIVCEKTYNDAGTVSITINGFTQSTNYGVDSTSSSIASQLASQFNSAPGTPVTATLSGSTITFTSIATGSAANYSLSVTSSTNLPQYFGTPSFGGYTSGSTLTGGTNAQTIYDSGTATVTVNGHSDSAGYGQGSTTSSIASTLASAINADGGAYENASASGNVLTLTAKTTGSTTDYSLSASITYDSTDFSSPSFGASPSGSALTGGTNSQTIHDSGTVTLTVNGHAYPPYNYGQNDTSASSVVNGLVSIVGTSCPATGPVMAGPNGGTLNLTSCVQGASTDYPFSVSITYDSTDFSSPSFSASPASGNLTGGQDGSTTYDSGTVSVTVDGPGGTTAPAQSNYGQGSTAIGIAQNLAQQLSGSSFVSASAVSNPDGTASLAIASRSAGSASNYSFTTTASGSFSPPSFGISPSGQLAGGADAGTTGVAAYQAAIGYAADGDVASVTDSVNGTWNYAYDDFNRLVAASCSTGCPDGQSALAFTYDYDLYGNRWHQNVTAGAGPAPQLSFGGANNRVDQFAYDAAGDVTGDGVHSYTYDAENRLVSVDGGSTATYVYDALGRRVEKTTSAGSVYYLYDLAGNVVTELSATGDWNRVEIYAAGKHIATYSGGATGTTYFDHVDWLGTERARTDAQGDMAETCTSLAFGDDLSCTGTDGSPLHFTGKQRDTETGNDYFGARYYGSGAGRFMSSDWSSVPVAIPYADLTNPQTLNLYVLVRDNPETFADLDGHCPPGQPCDPDATNWQRPFSKTGEPHGQKPGDGQPVPQQAKHIDNKQVGTGLGELGLGGLVLVGILQPEVSLPVVIGGSLASSGFLAKGVSDVAEGATGGGDTSEMKEAMETAQNPVAAAALAYNGGNAKQANTVGSLVSGVSAVRDLAEHPRSAVGFAMAARDAYQGLRAAVSLVMGGVTAYRRITTTPALPQSLRPPAPPNF